MLAVLATAFIVLGLAVVTVAVYGTWRLHGILPRMHAATKASSLGVAAILVGSIGTRNLDIIGRALLVGGLLLLTAAVSGHAIGQAAHRRVARDEASADEER